MRLSFLLLASGSLVSASTSTSTADYASPCYASPLPELRNSTENRTIPWGTPSFILPNGTTCCSSLTEVRAGIDVIDSQLVALLAQRAAYVREATRFKATLATVDVPERDAAVIAKAIAAANSTSPRLPATVAEGVYKAIIAANVPFEECVFEKFAG
ncbi:hypothetical protein PVAG01_00649 [Phlyctema vagabunda]|uniref:Chorismate mutase domain-containing protein n=1 Tax=Phlyctema vagabunda TaxID=108571 RepID=A0ABR4PUW5_9HELO